MVSYGFLAQTLLSYGFFEATSPNPAVGALSTIPDWRFAAIDLEARRHIGLANINKFNSIVIQYHTIKTQETNTQRWQMDNFQNQD